ncbi:MAG: hypothetical protein WBA45_12335 [Microthrixaceae bacterium]
MPLDPEREGHGPGGRGLGRTGWVDDRWEAGDVEARIMYIESKADGLTGEARIGRVTFSKTGKTITYRGRSFQSLKGGYKANYYDVETGEEYWISGPRRDGADRLYGERLPVEIDDDVRVEYWTEIRNRPELSARTDACL